MVMRDSLWFCLKGREKKAQHEVKFGFIVSSSCSVCALCDCVCKAHSTTDGPEGDHPLNAIRVAATVGLKAGIVSLLQHKLLAAEAGVLVAHPTVSRMFKKKKRQTLETQRHSDLSVVPGYLRATLHLQGTDVVHPALNDVLAGGGELHALALEVLLVVHSDLEIHVGSGKSP